MIKTNISYTHLTNQELNKYQNKIHSIHKTMITERKGLGSNFLGWVDLPKNYNKTEWEAMKIIAKRLIPEIQVLIVIGIGGSYLGAKAAIDMIKGLYSQDSLEIIFVGNTLSSTYTNQVLEYVKDKEFAINVISKSGSTTEPAIAFRLFRDLLEQQKGKAISKTRIIATTDAKNGILKNLADQEGYETLVIPDDIGGRFSVLTPVGIFVMAMAGIDIDRVILGANQAYTDLSNDTLENQAYKYAVVRTILHQEKQYPVEMLVSYEIQMSSLAEWWKQLFGESEGKDSKGILPASVNFSTDLHSLGQFIQEGSKVLFETVLQVKKPSLDVKIATNSDDVDQLNYLTNYSLHQINALALEGTIDAHSNEGKVPNIILELETMDEIMFGYLVYFFFKACAMSAYLLEVNPFNQPGVEVYKKKMFKVIR
ncbi:glucose-6-phosphate isomerase [Spiroplasma endosymbiont of 'Nebria riversi']|uniref:glucose-6-phosphate isomerase n=1 Tax=Spiroplasma endosymbiont of 'Nebria riversi' TaxID=2792084 RepID=UPI001C03E6FF|nr:glucose-6-phosphate isomerase [Spiroplasma endosymbiont of 'Nebria riversi']